MATFVLIHGAWHGGWCWWKVEPRLRQSGSRVYAPSLTGMGERSHLSQHLDPAAINLDLHIQDVVEAAGDADGGSLEDKLADLH